MPDQHDRDHQQRRRHRPQDEGARRVHRVGSPVGLALLWSPCSARRPARRRVSPPPGLVAIGAAVAAAGPSPPASARTTTLAPSRSLSAPSITMRSPGGGPSAPRPGPVGDAELDRLHRDRAVGVDQVDEGAGRAALDAAVDIVTTSLRVSTRRRMLTNWFGNSVIASLANWARSLTVPVVVSIWLSSV